MAFESHRMGIIASAMLPTTRLSQNPPVRMPKNCSFFHQPVSSSKYRSKTSSSERLCTWCARCTLRMKVYGAGSRTERTVPASSFHRRLEENRPCPPSGWPLCTPRCRRHDGELHRHYNRIGCVRDFVDPGHAMTLSSSGNESKRWKTMGEERADNIMLLT